MLPVLIAANIVAGTFCVLQFISIIDRHSIRHNRKLFVSCCLLQMVFGLPLLLIGFTLMFVSQYTMFPKRGWSPVVG